MTPSTIELLRRLEQTALLRNAGHPAPAYPDVQFLRDWTEAAEVCAAQISADASLEASSQLTMQLAAHHHEVYQMWNDKLREIKPFTDKLTEAKLARSEVNSVIPSHFRQELLYAIRGELLLLCMAHEYEALVPLSHYYQLIEHWYLAGHFPCGWIGEVPDEMEGAFEMGKLAVL